MGKWECYRCSFIVEADAPPEECPSCHYSTVLWLERVEERPSTVREYIRADFLQLDGNKSALDAAKLMSNNDAGSVLITSNGQVVGIVTETDIMKKVAAVDATASKILVKDIMTFPIISVAPDTQLSEAVRLMSKHHVRRLVVIEKGKPVGMVSQRSILGGSFRNVREAEEENNNNNNNDDDENY